MGLLVQKKENWHVSMVAPTFNCGTWRQRQGNLYEFQPNLVYYDSSPARATKKTLSKIYINFLSKERDTGCPTIVTWFCGVREPQRCGQDDGVSAQHLDQTASTRLQH